MQLHSPHPAPRSRRPSLAAAFALACFAVACAPTNDAARYGDAAAARGDWKAAERSYRAAIGNDPANADLSRKYQEAKTKAIEVALGTVNACRAQNDAACVEAELAYVLELEPTNVAAATERQVARETLAKTDSARAGELVAAGRPIDALQVIDAARARGGIEAVAAELSEHERTAAQGALLEASKQLEAARAGQFGPGTLVQLDQAAALAAAAAKRGVDATALAGEIELRRRELVAAVTREAVAAGDAAMAKRDFAAAARSYDQAATASRDAGLQRRAEYARQLGETEAAVRRRDFASATLALRAAIATGEDREGLASKGLELIEPRTYRIRLDGLMLTPTRPGTDKPWVGNSWLREVALEGGGAALGWIVAGPAGGTVGREFGKAAANVPPANQPSLRVWFELPDGRRYATRTIKGILVSPAAEFVVRSNALDQRSIVMRVQKVDGSDEDVAQVRVSLGELVSRNVRPELGTLAPALAGVQFWSEPVDDALFGAVANLEPQDGSENLSTTRSVPKPGRFRYRITRIETRLTSADIGDDFAGPPDPFIRMVQDGTKVFESKTSSDTRTATWSLATTELFVAPNEVVEVRVIDADPAESDTAFTANMSGAMLEGGRVTLSGRGGSTLVIDAERVAEAPR